MDTHALFTLGELLPVLLTRAIGCKWACLLFPAAGNEDFIARVVQPEGQHEELSNLRLGRHSPIVDYLTRERKPLTRENLATVSGSGTPHERAKKEIESHGAELFVPLVGCDRLVGILVLSEKQSGSYSPEDLNLLEKAANQMVVSIEKECLSEQLAEREEDLSVINRSTAIVASALDTQQIYDAFIQELKKVMDIDWAAIVLIERNDLYFLALSSEIGSGWQVGERIPVKDTPAEWVAVHRKPLVETDLLQESRFAMGEYYLRQGIRSIAWFPLIAKRRAIGSLIIASRHPNSYGQRHIRLLEQLASQIAMPVHNSRLYAEAEERARIDELTGLLNRRSLNELTAKEIKRHSRYGGVFSIIILDLDSFKAFNDALGHLAGDRLLRQVGSIMKASIRGADHAFRYGGDEFAILLPNTAIAPAYLVAERIRTQLALEVTIEDIPATASLGLASWPADGKEASEVIAAADGALYEAKRSGGNRSQSAAKLQ
ncbi:MAG: diguanylate cyclase [Chloroflexota bacterium]